MSEDDEREIVPGCNRGLHERKRRHAYFGKRAAEPRIWVL